MDEVKKTAIKLNIKFPPSSFKGEMKEIKKTSGKFKRKSSNSSSKASCHQKQQAKRRAINSSIMHQAEEFRSKLEAKYPCVTKRLLRSNVTIRFWMGLPHPFCKMYLPEKDTIFALENQNGEQYRVKYLAHKKALCGGWRGFSRAEKLSEGDVLVFQLVQPTKLKVYIFRESDSAKNAESCDAMSFPMEVASDGSGVEVVPVEEAIDTRQPSFLSAKAQKDEQDILLEDDPQILQLAKYSSKDGSEFSAENSKQVIFPAVVDDSGFVSFEEFHCILDDLLKKENELPHNIKCSYYQLCSSQKALLHSNLPKDINPLLIAGTIIETVNVAAAIKRCGFQTFNDESAIWDERLKCLKILGMEVEFLFSRLNHLQRLAYDPEVIKQHYSDLCSNHDVSKSTISYLEAELSELMKVFKERDSDIEKLNSEIEYHKSRFQEQQSKLICDPIIFSFKAKISQEHSKPQPNLNNGVIETPAKTQTRVLVFGLKSPTQAKGAGIVNFSRRFKRKPNYTKLQAKDDVGNTQI